VSPLGDAPAAASPPVVARGRGTAAAVIGLAVLGRRPVLVAFVAALIVRAVVAIAIAIGWGGSLFLDDASYSRVAEAAANGTLHQLGAYPVWLYERTGTLLVPLAGLYEVLGPVKLAGQLYVALLGAATAALTTRLALEIVDRRWAFLAGLLVALIPSQVLWSSIIMKDAAVWTSLSGLAVVAAVAARTTGRRLVPLALIAVALLVLLGFLRLHTLEVACVALPLAMLFSVRRQRPVRVAAALALLVCVPLAFGMGVAGGSFVAGVQNLGLQRAQNARQANSAIVPSDFGEEDGTSASASASASKTRSTGANLSYLPTGITVVALRPWPWEGSSGSLGLTLARLETLIWYPLVLLALLGVPGVWRHRRVLAFPVLCCGAILTMYGLTEGNLGTAYRHRGEVVWIVVLFATLGLERLVAWRRARAGATPAVAR
jgi:hypothetical protein